MAPAGDRRTPASRSTPPRPRARDGQPTWARTAPPATTTGHIDPVTSGRARGRWRPRTPRPVPADGRADIRRGCRKRGPSHRRRRPPGRSPHSPGAPSGRHRRSPPARRSARGPRKDGEPAAHAEQGHSQARHIDLGPHRQSLAGDLDVVEGATHTADQRGHRAADAEQPGAGPAEYSSGTSATYPWQANRQPILRMSSFRPNS